MYKNSKVRTISKQDAEQLIKENKGKFFSCEFTKQDGSHRKIHGRTGVKKGVVGTVKRATKSKAITLWEKEIDAFRKVIPSSISKLTLMHRTYKVV